MIIASISVHSVRKARFSDRKALEDSVGSDQTPQIVASDQGLYRLLFNRYF